MEDHQGFVCSACGLRRPGEELPRINTTLTPAAREEILQETYFVCPQCGQALTLLGPCLYHDMERRQMVALLPLDFQGPLKKGSLAAFAGQDPLEGYTLRRVSRPWELTEKLALWEQGRQDTLVEICKVVLFARLQESRGDFGQCAARYRVTDGQEQICFVRPDGVTLAARLDAALYRQVEEAFAPCTLPPEDFPQVDFAWATGQRPRK